MDGNIVDKFRGRYVDAYHVASAVIGFGRFFKGIGIFLAIALAILSFIVGSQYGAEGTTAGIGVFFVGLITGLVFYGVGILISAQGQIVRATLDTAVNSSPHLGNEEKEELIFDFRRALPSVSIPTGSTQESGDPMLEVLKSKAEAEKSRKWEFPRVNN